MKGTFTYATPHPQRYTITVPCLQPLPPPPPVAVRNKQIHDKIAYADRMEARMQRNLQYYGLDRFYRAYATVDVVNDTLIYGIRNLKNMTSTPAVKPSATVFASHMTDRRTEKKNEHYPHPRPPQSRRAPRDHR